MCYTVNDSLNSPTVSHTTFNTHAKEDTIICDYLTKLSDISPLHSLCLLPAS